MMSAGRQLCKSTHRKELKKRKLPTEAELQPPNIDPEKTSHNIQQLLLFQVVPQQNCDFRNNGWNFRNKDFSLKDLYDKHKSVREEKI